MDLDNSLAEAVGTRHVLTDPELKSAYERDYTGRYIGEARLVVRPADAAEVAGLMAACHQCGAAVVPQGGNTGLVGASVPRNREVVISLQRLTEIGELDTAVGQVTVAAGTTLAALQRAGRAAGQDAEPALTSPLETRAPWVASWRATRAAPAHCATALRAPTWPDSRPSWQTGR